jgi:hypothetical protein
VSEAAPFFIVGNDRSGTTMLRLVLDRGPDVAIPPESMFLADFEPVRRAGDLADPVKAARLLEEIWRHPRVRLWRLSSPPPPIPPGLTHEQAYRFVVEAPFRAYAADQRKTRFADKTPLYLRYVDVLAEIWPEARFVVLVRDGRDVALSVMRLPFGANNVWAAASAWADGIRLGREAERVHAGKVLTVRYEDLVADPPAHVERLCGFLDLTYEPDMLAIENSDPAKIVQDQAGWFTSTRAGINTTAVGKWRRELSSRQQRVFGAVAGEELRELGYETTEQGSVSIPETAVYITHNSAMRAVNLVRLRLVQERGRELRYVLRRKLARA